jgi:hypothetical protein
MTIFSGKNAHRSDRKTLESQIGRASFPERWVACSGREWGSGARDGKGLSEDRFDTAM